MYLDIKRNSLKSYTELKYNYKKMNETIGVML